MCGIAGLFRPDRMDPAGRNAVQSMSERMAHRGPDDAGFFADEHVALGHRRLSIIDLSDGGHQPMASDDGQVQVLYNGEVYNQRELRHELEARGHRFSSTCDTEVVLRGFLEWGVDGLVERLRGMFALAVYDARAPRLVLARDRLGIKPLYYAEMGGGGLAFASEVKALDGSGLVARERDADAMIGFLLYGAVPEPMTTVRGVRCLSPGTVLTADRDGLRTRHYWDVLQADPSRLPQVKPALEDAVARHLVADVPLGVFLSGGVDSIGIAALARRAGGPVHTLTVALPDDGGGERALAREAATWIGTTHEEVSVGTEDFVRSMPRFLAAMDQPTNDGLNTFTISEAARRTGLKVVLSGLGGDEVFWGYPHYRRVALGRPMGLLRALPRPLRGAVAAPAIAFGAARGSERWRRAAYLGRLPLSAASYLLMRGFFPAAEVARLLGTTRADVQRVVEATTAPLVEATAGLEPGRALNYFEDHRYLHDQLLRDADVFSMASSIELRVPYLDHELVEAAWRLPVDAMLDDRVNKPALVEALGDPRVERLARLPKRGFSLPMDRWMRETSGTLEEMVRGGGALDRRAATSSWRAFVKGRLHWSRAWALVVAGQAPGSPG